MGSYAPYALGARARPRYWDCRRLRHHPGRDSALPQLRDGSQPALAKLHGVVGDKSRDLFVQHGIILLAGAAAHFVPDQAGVCLR